MKILFVDDEPAILRTIRRTLRQLPDSYRVDLVSDPAEAMQKIEDTGYDLVVSDMRMPGISGHQVLAQAAERIPGCVRALLSGYSGEEETAKAARYAHLFVGKPFEPEVITDLVTRAEALGSMFLPDALRQRLGGLRALPPVPEHFVALTRMLGDDSQAPSLSDIASILAKDVALAARILQLANSAFFGGGAFAGNLEQAVKLLGLRLISGLVLQHEVFTNMELSPETARWRDSLNRESLATADLASRIARQQGAEPRQRDEAYLAGLLLDTGRLVLATEDHVPVDADRLREGLYGAELCLEEETLFGVHHGWAGAYLLQLWGFPRSVVEAVAWHHQPSGSGVEGVSTLTRAYLADALASIRRGEAVALDWEYLQSIGYSRDAEAWADVPELQELVSCAAGAA